MAKVVETSIVTSVMAVVVMASAVGAGGYVYTSVAGASTAQLKRAAGELHGLVRAVAGCDATAYISLPPSSVGLRVLYRDGDVMLADGPTSISVRFAGPAGSFDLGSPGAYLLGCVNGSLEATRVG
ncbi:MAG: hypothetical protein JRN39_05895 [Nitrososphaerota archaeon]|nr:hypothetical protein [Nitrososphaerota archaeon]MDG6939913.1 hypothetical protein [Nitrososphaerota archaeon]